MELIIVTGLSGSGRRSVLAVLEDSGFIALDNVPPQLLKPLVDLEGKPGVGNVRMAVGMDSRQMDSPSHLALMLEQLRASGVEPFVLFLECRDDVLMRRYSESRRPHRYAEDGNIPAGIARERILLQPVRKYASMILDTSGLTLYQLNQRIANALPKCNPAGTLMKLISFGFKHGIPSEANMVFDARFLPNPFYMPELRPLTGKDAEVQAYLDNFEGFHEYLDRLEAWLMWSWPHVLDEAKAYHYVAIGCTGGHHRSVALVERLAERLSGRITNISTQHRDLNN